MKKLFAVSFAAILIALAGCSTTQQTQLDAASKYDQPYACKVMLEHDSIQLCKHG